MYCTFCSWLNVAPLSFTLSVSTQLTFAPLFCIVIAGDLLLLEAGPTFMQKNSDSDKYFSLLAEVENSAPPRLRMLIPALGMLFQNSFLLPFYKYPSFTK